MPGFLVTVFCLWLGWKVLKLMLMATWGLMKVVSSVLLVLAVPVLVVCLVVGGGLLLLVPVGLIAAAFGLLKAKA